MSKFEEARKHFRVPKRDFEDMYVFDREEIERVGSIIASDLRKGKGRAIIDYDPDYPHMTLRIFTDTPVIPDKIYDAIWDGERYIFKRIPHKEIVDSIQVYCAANNCANKVVAKLAGISRAKLTAFITGKRVDGDTARAISKAIGYGIYAEEKR